MPNGEAQLAINATPQPSIWPDWDRISWQARVIRLRPIAHGNPGNLAFWRDGWRVSNLLCHVATKPAKRGPGEQLVATVLHVGLLQPLHPAAEGSSQYYQAS